MELIEAIKLISNSSIPSEMKTRWADLGCGSGLFTHALASQIAAGSKIYAVDKNISVFGTPVEKFEIDFEKVEADFIKDDLQLKDLDGIQMANSLHFAKDKISLIHKLKISLKAGGIFLIVEYDMQKSNPWVPFPVGYDSLAGLFATCGYHSIHRIGEMPSRYNGSSIYSAVISI